VTKKSPPPETATRGPVRPWPPTCSHPRCDWTGEPNGVQSPYVACGGQPERHVRVPVGGAA
jgi:hypothetical protein